MTPFILDPPIKDYIWGGTKLRDEFGKESQLERLAESWELSCHPDGESLIAGGEFTGMTLSEFAAAHPEALGENAQRFDRFPVLVKLIDAKDDLSVQVHPADDYARRNEGDNGKTEMWYIVDCVPGAELIYGFKEHISQEQFRQAIEDNSLLNYVNRVPVKKGDVFFIQPGTLHAIGKGILIAEIQQNSNVTYRVYDYGRKGADGQPRQLHVDKAIDITLTAPPTVAYGQPKAENNPGMWRAHLADCEYFSADKYDIFRSMKLGSPRTFQHILLLEGEAVIESGDEVLRLKKGSSVFVPAGTDTFNIKGKCSIIITTVPD